MNRKKFKANSCLLLAILTMCSSIRAQLLLDSDLMIKEIDYDSQDLLPEKEIVYMREKRDDDDGDVGSGSFDFTPLVESNKNSSVFFNATRAINLDSITVVVNSNQESTFQGVFVIVASAIGGLVAITLIIAIILLACYVKKRYPVSPSRAIASAPPPPPHSGTVRAYNKNETNDKKTRRINVTNTTMTEIEI